MGLSEIDRNLLERCLQRKPRAWEDFVDRFMGLLLHVIDHTAQARSVRLSKEDRDDLCAEVLLAIIKKDFALLRKFRGESSLATYLAVVARRLVVHSLLDRKSAARLGDAAMHAGAGQSRPGEAGQGGATGGAGQGGAADQARTMPTVAGSVGQPAGLDVAAGPDASNSPEQRIEDQEEVNRLLDGLADSEARVVRLYHLEGKSYQEISQQVGMPTGSIGPILTRARQKMRRAGVDSTTG